MSNLWRKLDNTAKVLSLDDKKLPNTFRLSVILKEEIEPEILKSAVIKTLDTYPSYKVRMRTGFFWNYLESNSKQPIVEKSEKRINFFNNNEYLFKVTYFKERINLDVLHVLTDGLGAIILLKEILYNYFNFKYNLKMAIQENVNNVMFNQDEHLKNADKRLIYKDTIKKAFTINQKSNLVDNKTYYYILDLEKFKNICKKHNVSITEYLSALHIYAIYKTVYDKSSNKDIALTIPIDLRKHYNVGSFSNFFTCMKVNGNVSNDKEVTFDKILVHVHRDFKSKGTLENIKKYLSKDVKLGTNLAIRLVPLFMKKIVMKYIAKITNQTTSTLSNIGQIKVEEQYKKYIDNVLVSVSTGKVQKVKCTICSYENNLTVTINSNLISNKFEKEFYRLLKKHVGEVKLEEEII